MNLRQKLRYGSATVKCGGRHKAGFTVVEIDDMSKSTILL